MYTTLEEKSKKLKYFFYFTVFLFIVIIFLFILKIDTVIFKNKYYCYYNYGSGLTKGTIVTINGITVGEITNLNIDEKNRIKVEVAIDKKYSSKIKSDSVAKIVRPLLIGNKQISISAGSPDKTPLKSGSTLISEESSEIVDLISGISISEFVKKLDLKKSFFDLTGDNMVTAKDIYEQSIAALVTMNEFQKSIKNMSETMNNLSANINSFSTNITSFSTSINGFSSNLSTSLSSFSKSLQTIEQLSTVINEMSKSIQKISSLEKSMQDVSASMNNINANFVTLSNIFKELNREIKNLEPALSKIDFEKINSLLSEFDILLRAMQQNWMFKKEVDQILKQREKEKKKSGN